MMTDPDFERKYQLEEELGRRIERQAMNNERLDELEKLCDAATEGPWSRCADQWGAMISLCAGERSYFISSLTDKDARDTIDILEDEDNTAFIAAARTALPELIAEVRRLQKEARGADSMTKSWSDAAADMYRTISAIAHTCALANDPECYNSRHYMSYREMHELVLEDLKKYKLLCGEDE